MLGAPGRPRTRRRSRPDIPKDYLEAFGNIYTEAADAIDATLAGQTSADVLAPGIDDGAERPGQHVAEARRSRPALSRPGAVLHARIGAGGAGRGDGDDRDRLRRQGTGLHRSRRASSQAGAVWVPMMGAS